MFSLDFYLQKGKVIVSYMINQGMVQVLTAVAGLLAVRYLTKTELAYYTIASSIQTALMVSSDLGITIAVQSMGGKNWNNDKRLSEIINAAYSLRRYLIIIAAALVLPFAVWLFNKNGAPAYLITVILAIIFIDWLIKMKGSFLGLYFRIVSRIKDIKFIDLTQNIIRTSLILLLMFLWFNTISLLLAGLVATIYIYIVTVHRTKRHIDLHAETNAADRKEIMQVIRSQIPYFLFFILQGQITIWLISVFGNTNNLADFGAITRLAMILSVLGNVYSVIIGPAFSRCHDKQKAIYIFWQSIAAFILVALVFIAFSAFFPEYFLWIIGEKYNYLQKELLLMVCATMLSSLAAVVIALNNAKGWMKESWLIIPATVIAQIIGVLILDLHELKSIIIFNIISNLPTLFVYLYMTRKGFRTAFK